MTNDNGRGIGISVRSGSKGPVITMENSYQSAIEKSLPSEMPCQGLP